MIDFKNVTFSYHKERIFSDFNLKVAEGEFVILVGPNGGGKTTILKLLAGILKPNSGSVDFSYTEENKIVSDVKKRHQRKVAYVSQGYNQNLKDFPATVEEVVALGLLANEALKNKKARNHVVNHVLQLVKIEEMQKKRISELSGGQQQRVMVARALVSNPQVLLLDEPTSGIDMVASEKIFKLLQILNKNLGITIVMVSHDIENAVKYASKVACLNKHLCYYGTSENFMEEHIANSHKWFYAKG